MSALIANARRLFLGFFVFWAVGPAVQGQQTQAPAAAATLPNSTGYVCVQRGPNSRIWQNEIFATNSDGEVKTNCQSYTELGTGICYLDGTNYVDSVEEVDAVAGGAQAVQGLHKVQWAINGNTPGGAVTITTPDAKQLSCTVFGVAYYDASTGSNAAIGLLQDCTGSIAAPNQVIYGNAFSNLNADLCYTYTKAGLSQDLVLRQAPPAPDAYGLSDASSVLQLYTEWFNSPEPEATSVTNGNALDEQVLNFGAMSMGVGHLLFFNGQQAPVSTGTVNKQWVHVNNRTFLIESVPWSAISNQVQQLHPASNLNPRRESIRGLALLEAGPKESRPKAAGKDQGR